MGNARAEISTLYYYSMADCNRAYDDNTFASWQFDACQLCMQGKNKEFATIDGPTELGGIVFSYDMEDEWTDCDIHNQKWVSCADGWYGLPEFDNGEALMGCSKCPSPGSTTPRWDGKETQITSCYIPATKKLTDISGTYSYTQDCYYTK